MQGFQSYKPLWWIQNRHLNTIVPNRVRKFPQFHYDRERLQTQDDDFIDLDWYWHKRADAEVVLLLHGLEGSSRSGYMIGLSQLFHDLGYHVCCMNFRGCSGEPNWQLVSYHSGKRDDLEAVIHHITQVKRLGLNGAIGFSLGANLLLRYLGDDRTSPAIMKKAVAISAPVDLANSGKVLQASYNKVYLWHFLRKLKLKAREKQQRFPNADINWAAVYSANSLKAFDDAFTAPIHGFANASDYYTKSSALSVLSNIQVSSLIINAQDDSFLSSSCYPKPTSTDHWQVLYPTQGGHVGFIDQWPLSQAQWHERAIAAFWINN